MSYCSFKSQYELIMEQLEQEGKIVIYTEQDRLAIIEDINNGRLFSHKQKISEKLLNLN